MAIAAGLLPLVGTAALARQGANFKNGAPATVNIDYTVLAPPAGANAVTLTGAMMGLVAGEDYQSLSDGFDPLNLPLWDFVFSVAPGSLGVPGSGVRLSFPPAQVNLFFTNDLIPGDNVAIFGGTIDNADWGLTGADTLEAVEIIDSMAAGGEDLAPPLVVGSDFYFTVTGSAMFASGDICYSNGMGAKFLFASAATVGLAPGDVIDALSLLDVPPRATPIVPAASPGDIAVFSLTPASPSAANGATLYYSTFAGVPIATTPVGGVASGPPGPLMLPAGYILNAPTLGLLATDDVDALDISATGVGGLAPPVPSLPWWALSLLAFAILFATARRLPRT